MFLEARDDGFVIRWRNDTLTGIVISNLISAYDLSWTWNFTVTLFCLILSYSLFRKLSGRVRIRRTLKKKRVLLETARNQLIERVKNIPERPDLQAASGAEILDQIRSSKIMPIDALHVYQKKLVKSFGLNAVCDIIEDAEETATNLPPHGNSEIWGLPVSIKENISVAGYDTSIGLVSRVLKPMAEDGTIVKVLRAVGAVPFVTTTMSPTGMCLDASTCIFGQQRNPYDPKRLAGGSSSGEAILIAKDISPLGFGTDIAGSVRFPAAVCGICALKPTSARVSTTGVLSVSQKSCVGLRPVFGPMSKEVRLLIAAMRSILSPVMFDLDPRVPRMVFNEDIFISTKPLTIGYYENLGGDISVNAVASVRRAIDDVVNILGEKGKHKVVPFNVPEPNRLCKIAMKCILADGGINLREVTENETLNSRLRKTRFLLGLPAALRRVFGSMVSAVLSKGLGAGIIASTGCQTPTEVFDLLKEVTDYQVTFAKAWAEANLDVLICPALPFPAPLESTPDALIMGGLTYSSLYNLLDYPAGIIPVVKVSDADIKASADDEQKYRKAGDYLNAWHAKLQRNTEGLPIAVQVVGRPLEEENVLRVLSAIELGRSEEF